MIDLRIIPLGIYPDNLPAGEFVYGQMFPDATADKGVTTGRLVSHVGDILMPGKVYSQPGYRLLFNRITTVGGFRITSSAHAFLIQYYRDAGGVWHEQPPVNGTQGALFGPDAIEDGALTVPDGPGLGVTLDESAVRAHPYRPPGLRRTPLGAGRAVGRSSAGSSPGPHW